MMSSFYVKLGDASKVERVVLNALATHAVLPPDIRAFGDLVRVVFREADPP
jgi:hypothetical protein